VANQIMKERVFVIPEAGSAALMINDIRDVLGEFQFNYFSLFQSPVPTKDKIRKLINNLRQREGYRETYIGGDLPHDIEEREYMISWRNLQHPDKAREEILRIRDEREKSHAPHEGGIDWENVKEIDWDNIWVRAARTTVDFLHKDAQKHTALLRFLEVYKNFKGPVLGFSDWGDAFAQIVPTINVNPQNPNIFRITEVSYNVGGKEVTTTLTSMDYNSRWRLMEEGEYDIHGRGENAKVFRDKTLEEVRVVRTQGNRIFLAKDHGDKAIIITPSGDPIFYRTIEIGGDEKGKDKIRMILTLPKGEYEIIEDEEGKKKVINPKTKEEFKGLQVLRSENGEIVRGIIPSMVKLREGSYRIEIDENKKPRETEYGYELGENAKVILLREKDEKESEEVEVKKGYYREITYEDGTRGILLITPTHHSMITLSDMGVPIRDTEGNIIRAPDGSEIRISRIEPDEKGHPIEIIMSPPPAEGELSDIRREPMSGCGKATARIIRELVDMGYFNRAGGVEE